MNRRAGHVSEAPGSFERADSRKAYDCAVKLEECRQNLVRLCCTSGEIKEFNDEEIEKTAMEIIRTEEEEAKKIARELLHQKGILNRISREAEMTNLTAQWPTQENNWPNKCERARTRDFQFQNASREPGSYEEAMASNCGKGSTTASPCKIRRKVKDAPKSPGIIQSSKDTKSQIIHIKAGDPGTTDNAVHIIITAVTGERPQALVENLAKSNTAPSSKGYSADNNYNPEDSGSAFTFENERSVGSSAPYSKQPTDSQRIVPENSDVPPSRKEQRNCNGFEESYRPVHESEKFVQSQAVAPAAVDSFQRWNPPLSQTWTQTFQYSSPNNSPAELQTADWSCDCSTQGQLDAWSKQMQHCNDGENMYYPYPANTTNPSSDLNRQGRCDFEAPLLQGGVSSKPVESHLDLLKDLSGQTTSFHQSSMPPNSNYRMLEYSQRTKPVNSNFRPQQTEFTREPFVSSPPPTPHRKCRSNIQCSASDKDTSILLAIAKAAINLSLKKQRGEEENDECDPGYPNLLDTIFEK